jgi:FKBP-type peptidyl-prolyl cis-trans isomerase (trigger factor)
VAEGGAAKDFVMTLGTGQMLPEFDEALLNVTAIEDKEIQLTIQGQTISSNFGTLNSSQFNT